MGMSQIGIIHVSIYPSIGTEEYEYILNHSEVEAVIVGSTPIYKKIETLVNNNPKIKYVYSITPVDGIKHLSELIDFGKKHYNKNKPNINQLKAQIKPDDILTIIYTSGTTGEPKGVLLTHNNLVSNILSTAKIYPFGIHETQISFLPLCHIFERLLNYMFLYKGITIYYIENLTDISPSLKTIKPDGFGTVPRILELFYDKIVEQGKDLEGFKKHLFFWAIELGKQYDFDKGLFYSFKLNIAKRLVLNKIKQALGGNLKIVISGGSAIQVPLQRLFWAMGIKVIEGYGLTETSPVISVNHPNKKDTLFGTVGLILENVSVKIAKDGEILVKGPNVMKGYYKNETETRLAIDEEGWFHTGDIGEIIENRFLKITDRKKEIFKLSSGKYIAPQMIENKLKTSALIEQAMVIGENKKHPSALLVPNFNYLHFWATKHKVHYKTNKDLVQSKEVTARFQKEINKINKDLGIHENIKRFKIVCEEWSSTTRELSPTLKLRRNYITKKYQHIINAIYNEEN
jgi:long-chain acyl-CoA synthetase